MEEVIKQLLPGLAKSSPYLIGGGAVIILLTKIIIKYLKEQSDKKETQQKERDEKREKFFTDELDKKDVIIHEKDAEIKALNMKLVELIRENIEVTKNNSVLFENLKDLLKVALNSRQ